VGIGRKPPLLSSHYRKEKNDMQDKIISFMGTGMGFIVYGAFIYLVAYTIAGPAA
jgi:hypothetical protein